MSMRAFSSPRALLYLGPVRVGWVTGLSISPNMMGLPIKVLGDIYAKRIEAVDSDASGSFSTIKILEQPMSLLRDSRGRRLWGDQLMTNRQWIEYDPPPLTLVDQVSGQRVITCLGIFPNGHQFGLSQGGVASSDFNFRCIRAFEHSESIFTGQELIQGDIPQPIQGLA